MGRRIRRLADVDYAGPHRYSLTICTYQSAAIFTRAELVSCVCTQILQAAGETGYAVTVYTAMPDHFHMLVDGRDATKPLPEFVKRAKQGSGYHGKKIVGRRIWQRGYYDDVLRPSESTREYIRYIVMNPVAAGLATDPLEYPFTGSGIHAPDELRTLIRTCCDLISQ